MSTGNVSIIDNTVSLNGAITFYNAPEVCAQLWNVLPTDREFTIDLKQVTECDSASIVVLLQIVRFATQHQQQVKFSNIKPEMRVLIELYDLKSLLLNKN